MTSEPTRTLGVAVAVPEPWGGELQRLRASFGDARAAAIPTHVTLLPPTPVDDGELPKVEQHLDEVAATAAAFELLLRGTGTFRPTSPVVFVTVARGISACESLAVAVRSGPLARDLDFPYHPHVTVAHGVAPTALDQAFDALRDFEAAFVVDGFWLYEHGSDGVWRPRRHCPFGATAPTAGEGHRPEG